MGVDEVNELMLARRAKLQALIDSGEDPYKSNFERTHQISQIVGLYSHIQPGDVIEGDVRLAGRIVALREHGKASFAVIAQATARIQLFLTSDAMGQTRYEAFLALDIGDWVGVTGQVTKTRRGELSLRVEAFELLTKSLRPLPEKWHGLTDVETRYRQRYVDLIANPDVFEVFAARTRIVNDIREFLVKRGFVEVETPMLQPIPGGATARPFVTHHNALDADLYLRIAPELYLKRLLVGGFDRVFELNRNFRNEGISVKHNPEFTMLEVYQAYADYVDMMELTEALIKHAASAVAPGGTLNYQGHDIDFGGEWRRAHLLELVRDAVGEQIDFDMPIEALRSLLRDRDVEIEEAWGPGKLIHELFEKYVEHTLIDPTFVLEYPTEVTPLARRSPTDPNVTERFELIIAGREVANAFSELTDPVDQRRRFEAQAAMREAGDEEAQHLDEDYVRALEYGMPPAGGLGVGIDRLVMLLTDSPSIRDVLLFPQLRPEK
jgi:lysyl-tRNA synthetase class 2